MLKKYEYQLEGFKIFLTFTPFVLYLGYVCRLQIVMAACWNFKTPVDELLPLGYDKI